MDNETNIEQAQHKEPRSVWKRKESYVTFLVLPGVLAILVPLGGLPYLCGRFIPSATGWACILFPAAGVFFIYCFFAGVVRLLGTWMKTTRKRKVIIAAQIGIPLASLALLVVPFFIRNESHLLPFDKALVYGCRDRIRSKADIEAIRAWLWTLNPDEDAAHGHFHLRNTPKSVKAVKSQGVALYWDQNGNPKVRLDWGGGLFGHWGAEIGMEDMLIPPSDFGFNGEYRLPLEPGVYVWRELP